MALQNLHLQEELRRQQALPEEHKKKSHALVKRLGDAHVGALLCKRLCEVKEAALLEEDTATSEKYVVVGGLLGEVGRVEAESRQLWKLSSLVQGAQSFSQGVHEAKKEIRALQEMLSESTERREAICASNANIQVHFLSKDLDSVKRQRISEGCSNCHASARIGFSFAYQKPESMCEICSQWNRDVKALSIMHSFLTLSMNPHFTFSVPYLF